MISPAKAKREAMFYRDRLMRLRRSNHLYPWIQGYKKTWLPTPNGSTLIQQDVIQHKQPHNLFVSELVHANTRNGTTPGNSWGPAIIPCELQLSQASGEVDQSAPLLATQAFGSHADEIKRFRTGMRIPPQQLRTLLARTAPGLGSDVFTAQYLHALWIGFRGYQLYTKGSNPTPQYTYSELADRGYVAEPHTAVLHIYPNSNSLEEVKAQFSLTDDFAVDYITYRFNDNGYSDVWYQNFMVKLDAPGRPIMDDFLPAPLLGWELARTAWLWDQPLSAPRGAEWTVRVKTQIPVNLAQNPLFMDPLPRVTVAFHGHKLIKS